MHKRHLRGPVPYSTENEGLQSLVSEVDATIMNREVMEGDGRERKVERLCARKRGRTGNAMVERNGLI